MHMMRFKIVAVYYMYCSIIVTSLFNIAQSAASVTITCVGLCVLTLL